MIKLFSLLFLGLLTMTGSAQIKYFQGFEDGFDDMLLLDQDGKNPAEPVTSFGNTWTVNEDESGDHWAVSNSYFTEPAKANDWMITPVIENINENSILQWKAFSYNSLFPDQYEVRVSPSGGSNPSDFTKIIYSVGEESSDVVTRGITLSEFKGNSIRIAFRNISFDKYLLFLDDIKVEDVLPYNVSMLNLNYEKYPLVNTFSSLSFDLINTGSQTIDFIEFQLKIGDKEISFNKTGLNLNYLGHVTVSLDSMITYNKAEKILLELKVLLINGQSSQNISNQFTIHFLQNSWKRKLVAEDLTSTNCRTCPKGIFYKDKINASNGNDIITISVHNDDVMTNAAYEEGINEVSEFNNYPDFVMNRKRTIDPANLLLTVNNFQQNNFAPINLTTSASKNDRKVFIETKLTFNTSFQNDDLKIILSIVEDAIMGNSFIYNQGNIYAGGGLGMLGGFENLPDPIPYTDITYNHVARELPYGFEGRNDLLGENYIYGDSPDFTLEVSIDSQYVIENTSIVIMLADGTGEILNAEKINLNTVSTLNFVNSEKISVFPNPTKGMVEIRSDFPDLGNDAVVSILNAKGEFCKEFKIYDKMVDLSDFPAGLYFLSIRSASASYFCKVFKI